MERFNFAITFCLAGLVPLSPPGRLQNMKAYFPSMHNERLNPGTSEDFVVFPSILFSQETQGMLFCGPSRADNRGEHETSAVLTLFPLRSHAGYTVRKLAEKL